MWQILLIISLLFLIFEIFMPSFFFLNLAIAAFMTSFISVFTNNLEIIVISFVVLSFATLFYIRPIFLRQKDNRDIKTGVKEKYIGKRAKVIKNITSTDGAISIYGERWDARLVESSLPEIEEGKEVVIVSNDSLVMFVKEPN